MPSQVRWKYYPLSMRLLITKLTYVLADVLRKAGFHFREEMHPQVVEMRRKIDELGRIEFRLELYPDGSWSAESTNIEGIVTGSRNRNEIPYLLKDAVFTYFEVPPYACKDQLIRLPEEPVTVAQRVYAGR